MFFNGTKKKLQKGLMNIQEKVDKVYPHDYKVDVDVYRPSYEETFQGPTVYEEFYVVGLKVMRKLGLDGELKEDNKFYSNRVVLEKEYFIPVKDAGEEVLREQFIDEVEIQVFERLE